jgi:hypothetical protein
LMKLELHHHINDNTSVCFDSFKDNSANA